MLTTACLDDGSKISIDEYKKDLNKNFCCPLGHKLMAKKGRLVVHHFAHYPGSKCDKFRTGMTNWHSQWQRIVEDKNNLEVCLDQNGNKIKLSDMKKRNDDNSNNTNHEQNTSNSLFNSLLKIPNAVKQETFDQSHIADIINPNQILDGKVLVIEVQHSPIKKEIVDERERYYKNMIWIFDLTPRVVKTGKHNKIVFVDGKISYLREITDYVVVIKSTIIPFNELQQDEMDGIFIIIKTRTKYWYETTKPTYFDSGFCILELIMKLDKGFCLTKYITYDEFFKLRMPPLDKDKIEKCTWFHTMPFENLVKMSIIPNPILCNPLKITNKELYIPYIGSELECLELKRVKGGWIYNKFQSNTQVTILESLVMEAKITSNQSTDDAFLFIKLRKYLSISNNVIVDTYKYNGILNVRVVCNKETFACKDKFKALSMKFRKGVKNATNDSQKSRWIAPFKGFETKLNDLI